MRRHRTTLIIAGVLLAGVVVGGGAWMREARLPERPPIVLITVDTLRADRLGAYGHSPSNSPRIDALADSGVLFRNATTPSPRTTPAIASLFTGLWPQHHGSREVGQAMTRGTPLAAVLRRHGYATRAVTASGVVGRVQGFGRGFEQFAPLYGARAEVVTQAAIEAARESDPERPLFLWVHYFDPHFPYAPPSPWRPGAPGCLALVRNFGSERRRGHIFADQAGRSAAVLDQCRRLYDAEIAYVDDQVGRLLDFLQERDPRKRAIVIFTADHGENLGEDGLYYEHGPSAHDAGMRIPLLVSGPGVARGHVDDAVVRLEDLAPTLWTLAGVPPDRRPAGDGSDISARLRPWPWRDASASPRAAFLESGSALQPKQFNRPFSGSAAGRHCYNDARFSLCSAPGEAPSLFDHLEDPDLHRQVGERFPAERERLLAAAGRWGPEQMRTRSVRTPAFKLVERPLLEGGYRRELYHLARDPAERRDVSREHPRVFAELGRQLDVWTAGLRPFEPDRSEDVVERLRELGYVE